MGKIKMKSNSRNIYIYFSVLILITISFLLMSILYIQISPHVKTFLIYSTRTNLRLKENGFEFSEYINGIPQNDSRILDYIRTNHVYLPSKKFNNLTAQSATFVNHGQTDIIMKILQNKKNGFFVESGALDGELSSTTLPLEVNFGWTGLLIEPQPDQFQRLLNKDRKSICIDLCLSPVHTPIKLQFLKASGAPDVTRTGSLGDLKPQEYKAFEILEFQCFPVGSILAALNVTEIDYFSLDVEGSEMEILQTFPFEAVLVKTFSIEKFWRMEREALKTFMFSKGFDFIEEVHYDYIFAHQSLNYHQNKLAGSFQNLQSGKCIDTLSKSLEFDLGISHCRDAFYRPLKNSFLNTFYLTKSGVMRYYEGGCWIADLNSEAIKVVHCFDTNFEDFDKWDFNESSEYSQIIHRDSGKCAEQTNEQKLKLENCDQSEKSQQWKYLPKVDY